MVKVLCGPVLRRVTTGSVTVFLALRSPQRLTVRVFTGEDGDGGTGEVQTGSRDTVALGKNLHVAAVRTAGPALAAGTGYRYQVYFGEWGQAKDVPATAPTLFTPGWVVPADATADQAREAVGYNLPGHRLPGFEVAPDDPARLCLLHAADRLPHGTGPDALAYADGLVRAAVLGTPRARRPHLLLLGGNQIHADDVSPTMLTMVRATVLELGISDDVLPDATAADQPGALRPGEREMLTTGAKFAAPTANHLLSFAEYAAMYLLAWSPALWPASPPGMDDVHPDCGWDAIPEQTRARVVAGLPYDLGPGQDYAVDRFLTWRAHDEPLREFHTALPAVRRALANVPVLTTPGEHEVSGGWNSIRARSKAMLGTGVGRRVVANALAAYAVFQAWGDSQDAFADGPGAVLLARLSEWLAKPAPAAGPVEQAIATAAGLPGRDLVRPPGALTYHHLHSRPRWQLLVLDTHTQREFGPGPGDPPAPLAAAALDAELARLPAAAQDTVTVIATGVPLLRTPPREKADPNLRTRCWLDLPAAGHRFLARALTQRVAPGQDGIRRRRLVLLAGGDGHGYAVRADYSADSPYTVRDQPVEGVVAHLVTGPARHTTPFGARLHRDGYLPTGDRQPAREVVGWDQADAVAAGVRYFDSTDHTLPWQVTGPPQIAELTGDVRLDRRPEWRFRVDFQHSDLGQLGPVRPGERLPVEPPEPADEEQPWRAGMFGAAALNQVRSRDAWSAGTELVGENSLTELSFVLDAAGLAGAVATVWWRLPGKDPEPLTRFAVSTVPGPSRYDQQRYAGRALRRGDRDAAGLVRARYEGVEQLGGGLVRELQWDLVTLGFAVAGADPAGVFGPRTEWAVREFQNYARCEFLAQEREYPAGAPVPARHVDRLQRTEEIPEQHRYRSTDGLTGVVNRRTRELIGVWLANRWRCPVVLEGLRASGNPAGGPAGAPPWNTPIGPTRPPFHNIWLHTEPGPGVGANVFATDFTGRYVVPADRLFPQPAPDVPPPAGAPPLPGMVLVGQWTKWDIYDDHVPPRLQIRYEGPTVRTADNQQWRPAMEMLPQHVLPGAPDLAAMVAAKVARVPGAKAKLATYKVFRAVAEVEAFAYFDVINSYDNSFVSLGPCHWTAGTMNRRPGPNRPDPDWTVGDGELWGFLALVAARHPEVFATHFTRYGIGLTDSWGAERIWHDGARKYASTPRLETDGFPRALTAKVADYDFLHTWHSYYRFQMAIRTSPELRQAMWVMARQRMADVLSTRWVAAEGLEGVADVADDRPNRRPMISEVFTSEMATALIYRWHILSPGGMIQEGDPGPHLRAALVYARTGRCPTCPAARRTDPPPWGDDGGPNFAVSPSAWHIDHEVALTAGLLHRARHHASSENLTETIAQVNTWPWWQNTPDDAITARNPYGWSLPLAALPDGTDPANPENERRLRPERGSFELDTTDLPWPTGRQNRD